MAANKNMRYYSQLGNHLGKLAGNSCNKRQLNQIQSLREESIMHIKMWSIEKALLGPYIFWVFTLGITFYLTSFKSDIISGLKTGFGANIGFLINFQMIF